MPELAPAALIVINVSRQPLKKEAGRTATGLI